MVLRVTIYKQQGFLDASLVMSLGSALVFDVWPLFLFFLFRSIYFFFWLGIAVFAPRASHSFATAQKSNQKRPPLRLACLRWVKVKG